jgi:hypothetical protein
MLLSVALMLGQEPASASGESVVPAGQAPVAGPSPDSDPGGSAPYGSSPAQLPALPLLPASANGTSQGPATNVAIDTQAVPSPVSTSAASGAAGATAPGATAVVVPKRRALPAAFISPPFPGSEYQGSPPLIGIPTGPPSYPLMQALQGGWYGDVLNANRINVYGWVDVGGNLSSSRNSNVPLSYNIVPNSVQLDQAILRFERVPDSVQVDSMDWGFRFTNMYGIDYRYTTSKGYLSDQLLNHNNLYGYDPLEIYGLLYIPWVAQGLMIKIGRYVSPPDIEAQLAPDNYLYSHSVMYTYDPYTFTGIQFETKFNDQWTLFFGVHAGNDMAPWSNSAQPNAEVLARWVSKSNNDSVYFGLDSIGDGRYKNEHDDLQVAVFNWQHRFNDRVHTMTEGYFIWQHNALLGGTVINGPPKSFFEAVGPGPLIPGISPSVGGVNYTNFLISPTNYITVRNDFLDDIKGQRTGFATLYTESTVGWAHYFSNNLITRPEVRYERSWQTPAYDNGTRKNQFTVSADVIIRF